MTNAEKLARVMQEIDCVGCDNVCQDGDSCLRCYAKASINSITLNEERLAKSICGEDCLYCNENTECNGMYLRRAKAIIAELPNLIEVKEDGK